MGEEKGFLSWMLYALAHASILRRCYSCQQASDGIDTRSGTKGERIAQTILTTGEHLSQANVI